MEQIPGPQSHRQVSGCPGELVQKAVSAGGCHPALPGPMPRGTRCPGPWRQSRPDCRNPGLLRLAFPALHCEGRRLSRKPGLSFPGSRPLLPILAVGITWKVNRNTSAGPHP